MYLEFFLFAFFYSLPALSSSHKQSLITNLNRLVSGKHKRKKKTSPILYKIYLAKPPKRFELLTPGLRDQCSNH